jgi:hypothetical protein
MENSWQSPRPLLYEVGLYGVEMAKVAEPQFIESTAGQVAAELARRRIPPDQQVTVAIEPDDWLTNTRHFSRQKMVEAGWSDDDIDRLIKQAQKEVEPGLE